MYKSNKIKMKILLLIDSLGSGGRERRLIELIKGFFNYPDVHLHLVVFSDKIHYKEVFDLGIPVKILKRVPKRNPMVFYRLYKVCKNWKPDLIHSWGTMSAILAIPSSKLLSIKLINGNITNAPKNMGFFDERLFRARLTFPFSKVIVSNSLAGLKAYHVPEKKGRCIYNGFDDGRVSYLTDNTTIREQFGIRADKVIGMVGGFFDRKDYDTYLKAAIIILHQRKDVAFIALGDGPNLLKFREMNPFHSTSHFIFTGAQRDVESIINIFDIGVLSTNIQVHGEGVSNAIMEYMALGKPVVATSGGGSNEIVIEGKTGFLIPPTSPQIMVDKLMHLLDNPKVATNMGKAGRTRVLEYFSLDKMTNAYLELYTNLIKGD